MLPLPLPDAGGLRRVLPAPSPRSTRAACVGTAQAGGVSPTLPPPPTKTPPPGSEAQGDDPTVPFGYGVSRSSLP